MIRNATGAKHVYVPYNDQGKAFTDLIGKRITGVYASVSSAIPLIRSGQAHPIAVASTERLKSLPSVPTLMETYPDLALGVWNGFFAPAKTPQRVLESLSPHIFTAYRDPDVVKRVEEGGRSLHMGPDEADKFLRSEFVRWSELVRSLGIVAAGANLSEFGRFEIADSFGATRVLRAGKRVVS